MISSARTLGAPVTDPGGKAANQLLAENLRKPNDQLINALYLGVLSRYPSDGEMRTAVNLLLTAPSQAAGATNLLWILYNKVDFIFNY